MDISVLPQIAAETANNGVRGSDLNQFFWSSEDDWIDYPINDDPILVLSSDIDMSMAEEDEGDDYFTWNQIPVPNTSPVREAISVQPTTPVTSAILDSASMTQTTALVRPGQPPNLRCYLPPRNMTSFVTLTPVEAPGPLVVQSVISAPANSQSMPHSLCDDQNRNQYTLPMDYSPSIDAAQVDEDYVDQTLGQWKYVKYTPYKKQECEICSHNFGSKYRMILHLPCYRVKVIAKMRKDKLMINRKLICDKLKDKTRLITELVKNCNYLCPECGRSFTRKDILKHCSEHFDPLYKCSICSFECNYNHEAVAHENQHGKEDDENDFQVRDVTMKESKSIETSEETDEKTDQDKVAINEIEVIELSD